MEEKPNQIIKIPIQNFNVNNFASNSKEFLNLDTLAFRDGSMLSIPVSVIKGSNGPVVCMIAGQHGIELTGIYSVQKLAMDIDPNEVNGTLIIIPIGNPPAVIVQSRNSPIDSLNMNRQFPGNPNGQPTSVLAYKLFKHILVKSNILFDIHSGGVGEYLCHGRVIYKELLDLAKNLNFGIYHIIPKKRGTLLYTATINNIQAISIEAGEGRRVSLKQSELLIEGIKNFLRSQRILNGKAEINKEQTVFRDYTVVRAQESGFLDLKVSLGQEIKEGDVLANIFKVHPPKFSQVFSPVTGKILYRRTDSLLNEGDTIVRMYSQRSKA